MKKKVVRNSIYNGLATLFIGAIGFFVTAFIIGKLGAVEFGLIGIANIFSIRGYLSLAELGFQSSITKYTAEYVNKGDYLRVCQLTNTTLALLFCIGLALLLVGTCVYSLDVTNLLISHLLRIPTEFQSSFRIALGLIFASYLYQLPNVVFIGLLSGAQRFDLLKGTEMAIAVVNALVVIILLSMGFGYLSIIVLSLGLFGFQFGMYVYWTFRELRFLKLGPAYITGGIMKEIGGMSTLVFTGKISSLAFHQTSRLLVAIFLGPLLMAYYEIVTKLPRMIKTMVGFMNEAVVPASSSLSSEGREKALEELFLRGVRYQLCVSVPITTGAMFLATPFLAGWLGVDYGKLGHMMQTVLVGNLVSPVITIASSICLGMNRRLRELTFLSIATTVLSIVMSLMLIERYRLYGVIIATIASVVLVFPFYMKIFVEEFNVRVKRFYGEVGKIGLLGVGPLLVVYALGETNLGSGLISVGVKAFVWCVVYWLLIYVAVFDYEDKRLLEELRVRKRTIV